MIHLYLLWLLTVARIKVAFHCPFYWTKVLRQTSPRNCVTRTSRKLSSQIACLRYPAIRRGPTCLLRLKHSTEARLTRAQAAPRTVAVWGFAAAGRLVLFFLLLSVLTL